MIGENRFSDEFRKRIEGSLCVYCGDVATCKEHFPPATFSSWGLLLPCCTECNDFAGTSWASDFDERVNLVKLKISSKYKKLINCSDWTSEEINEMGESLKGLIISWEELRKLIAQRLAWNAQLYLSHIDHNNYFAQMLAERGSIIRFGRENFKSIETSEKKESWGGDRYCEYCGKQLIKLRSKRFCNAHRLASRRR